MISKCGHFLYNLCKVNGFASGIIFYFAIMLLACFILIRKQYSNPIITELLSDEIERIDKMYSKNTQKAKTETINFLLANKYSLMGTFGLFLAKVILGAIFAFGLASEEMSAYTSGISFDLVHNSYMLLSSKGVYDAPAAITCALTTAAFQYFSTSVISSQSWINNGKWPIISAVLIAGICFALPIGFSMIELLFVLIEYAVIVLNLTKFREKNRKFYRSSMKKYSPNNSKK